MLAIVSDSETIVAALSLPREVRADLALRLVESLDELSAPKLSQEEWDAAAVTEARRRWAAFEAGEVETIPAAEALREVRERLRRGR